MAALWWAFRGTDRRVWAEAAGWPTRYLLFRGSNRLEQTPASARRPVGYAAGIAPKLPTSWFLKYDLT